MSHAPEVIYLKFDPEASTEPKVAEIFRDPTARILWCLIKAGHITDQYFNDSVLAVGKAFSEAGCPRSYQDFLKLAKPLTSQYGEVTVFETFMFNQKEIDHEFWGDVFKALHNKRCFQIKIASDSPPPVVPTITDLANRLEYKMQAYLDTSVDDVIADMRKLASSETVKVLGDHCETEDHCDHSETEDHEVKLCTKCGEIVEQYT